MAERIIEVMVPPDARKEIAGYRASSDPVAKRMLLVEYNKVEDFLITEGYIKAKECARIRFVSDPNVNLNDPARTIKITGAVRDSEGHLFKFGKPECVLKINATINNKN